MARGFGADAVASDRGRALPAQTVLVLGCGIAGVAAARELRRRLRPEQRVVVIDQDGRASYPASFLNVAAGERRTVTTRPRARLARHGIEYVLAAVRHVDLGSQHVRAERREFRSDYLVLALGLDPAPTAIPGLAEAGHGFGTAEAAEKLAAALRYFSGGRVLIACAEGTPSGPASPYEAAMLLENYFHARGMRQKVEIVLLTREPAPLAFAGEEASALVSGLLAHKGIACLSGAGLAEVDAARHVVRLGAGSVEHYDLLVSIPPLHLPPALAEVGLPSEDGRVSVDATTLETAHQGVFAVGDLARVGRGEALRTAAAARAMGVQAARAIAQRLGAGPAPPAPSARGRLFIEVGGGAAMALEGDFLAPERGFVVSQPSVIWHWARALEERRWLWRAY